MWQRTGRCGRFTGMGGSGHATGRFRPGVGGIVRFAGLLPRSGLLRSGLLRRGLPGCGLPPSRLGPARWLRPRLLILSRPAGIGPVGFTWHGWCLARACLASPPGHVFPGPARGSPLRPGAGRWSRCISVPGQDREGRNTGKHRAARLARACRRQWDGRCRTIRGLAATASGSGLGRSPAATWGALTSPAGGVRPGIASCPGRTVLGGRALHARGGPAVPPWLAVGRGGLRGLVPGLIRRASPGRCHRARPRPGSAITRSGRRGACCGGRQVSRAGDTGLADTDGGRIGDRPRRLGNHNWLPEDCRTLPYDPGRQQERRQRTKADGYVDNRQAAGDNPRDKHCERHGNEDGANLDHSRPPRARLSHPGANAGRARALRRGGSRRCDRWARTARHRHRSRPAGRSGTPSACPG